VPLVSAMSRARARGAHQTMRRATRRTRLSSRARSALQLPASSWRVRLRPASMLHTMCVVDTSETAMHTAAARQPCLSRWGRETLADRPDVVRQHLPHETLVGILQVCPALLANQVPAPDIVEC
jgi:hypothetical protein